MASARAMGGPVPTTTRGTYIGKGRGRGRHASGDATKPPSPGSSSSFGSAYAAAAVQSQGGVDHILQLIEAAASSTNSQSLADQVLREAEKNIHTGDEVTQLANSLFQWATQSPDRAKRTAVICNALGSLARDGVVFYSPFVRPLKKNYDTRSEWRYTDQNKWLSLACLVCQFFNEFKLKGERIRALTEPASTCVELMLKSASLQSQKYGKQQLCDVGPVLTADKVDNMMDDLRHRLLASETPPSSRVLFLEALEVYAGGWQIDDSALDYYSNKKSGIA